MLDRVIAALEQPIAVELVALRHRLAWPLAAYGIGIVVMTIGSSGVTYSKMRLLVPAVTLLIPVAAGLARRRPATIVALLAVAALSSGYGSTRKIEPEDAGE